jgi:hypothetical protein
MTLKQRLTVLLLTPLLQPLPLKLLAQLPIVLLRPLRLHRALPIGHCLLQRNHKPAVKPTVKAWNVCSRNQCPNKNLD